jgi:hypothetical protein
MADNTTQTFPGSQVLGAYWINSGWSAVTANVNFGTTYLFYQSPITGSAGPAPNIANDLTSLGIDYKVLDRVPTGTMDYVEAYNQGVIDSPNVTRINTGTLNNYNGRQTEVAAGKDIEVGGTEYIANQRFLPGANGGPGLNAQVDGIAVDKSWWNGTTNTQIEARRMG